MLHVPFQKLSRWDLAYAVDMAVAALATYWVIAFVLPPLLHKPPDSVGILWAVISAVFVFRDTRAHSLAAGLSRLLATGASITLCLIYLLLFPASPWGMAILIIVGTLLMMLLGRRDEIGLTAITTAVVLIVAMEEAGPPWQQPLFRLIDTVVGIAVGIACKWIASYLFYHLARQQVR